MQAIADCAPDRVDLRGDWGAARFTVEVADTADTRAQGLMFRDSMATGAGMLFVYERPQTVSFWMRNTLIPLDMLFIDAKGNVERIHKNAVPLDETPIQGGNNIFAVLEINGGLADRFGITPGTTLRHPAFAGNAPVWPCRAP